MKTLIAPSILSADFRRLGDEVIAVERAGADWIHIDVMDGRFVPNITVGPLVVAAVKKVTSLPLDVHLMVKNPHRYIRTFAEAGADHLVIHAEAATHVYRDLQVIRDLKKLAGVSFNPGTTLSLLPQIIHLVDIVLIMSVNPGFGGQSFIEEMLDKVSEARRLIDESGRDIVLQVDGGVTPSNVARVIAAGATCLVAGTAVYGASDYRAAIETLRAPGHGKS